MVLLRSLVLLDSVMQEAAEVLECIRLGEARILTFDVDNVSL